MELLPGLRKPLRDAAIFLYSFVALHVLPFWIQLGYFVTLSLVGFLLLRMIPPKGSDAYSAPSILDVFFTSVSASTVSNMGTVEMEFFSNAQLVVLTILMLMGGEVFTSLLGFHLRKVDHDEGETSGKSVHAGAVDTRVVSDRVEPGPVVAPNSPNSCRSDIEDLTLPPLIAMEEDLKSSSARFLGFVVLGYLLVVHVIGSSVVLAYLNIVSTARDVLGRKNIPLVTFSVFSVVSSFSNCGFIPTNENMMVFRRHSGLLLLIASVILSGNTLYPPLLRSSIWALSRITRLPEFEYILADQRGMGYEHLLHPLHCVLLFLTVVGFLLVQFALFCSMEWRTEGLEGMNTYQKLVGALFMSVNARHAGESIIDMSTISSAVLVLYVVMMYLPPYTTFMPRRNHEADSANKKAGKMGKGSLTILLLSPLSYLAIFTIMICITERKKLSRDPLNFNVLHIVVEVVSAYGNVGFTTGYSCARRLELRKECRDMSYGFSGWWSDGGKLTLICVMLLGRLKKFNMKGGKAWVLS